ncbi:hypothetical protein BDZ97DRAFT_1916093 [Flammula alnicola]|nr:hypothetical protein BDZ97DRAFT_1916093 [Flammula alnicola]
MLDHRRTGHCSTALEPRASNGTYDKEGSNGLSSCHHHSTIPHDACALPLEAYIEGSAQGKNAGTCANKLPFEVLGQIFELTVERVHFRLSDKLLRSHLKVGYSSGRIAPFNLLQVCRYWRAVAQSTSSLWTSLSGQRYWGSLPKVPAMKYCLEQSLSAPLHLHLSPRPDEPTFYPSHARQMFQLFATEVHRWRSLSIRFDTDLAEDFIAMLGVRDPATELPLLEELEISFVSETVPPPDTVQALISLLALLKPLRHVYWNRDRSLANIPLHNLPWKQLDTVYIDAPISVQDATSYISQSLSASNITILHLPQRLQPYGLNLPNPTAFLPNLTSLTLQAEVDPFSIFADLVLPNLQLLEITFLYFRPRNYAPLDRFLAKSQCRLQNIKFFMSSMLDEGVVNFLQIPHLRSIPSVQLGSFDVHQKTLNILKTHARAKSFPPRLLAWTANDCLRLPYVGWKDIEANETLNYLWQDGNLLLYKLDEVNCDHSACVFHP